MKLYNTLTRNKEEFVIRDGSVRMYACGPTVYNYFHVGNARCFVVFDALRRYLEYCGNKVTFVQNFTDVDDKMIKKAREEHTTVPAIAERYIAEYYTDAHGLGIHDATVHPRATQHIQEIIELVQELIAKGHAYVVNGSVYFDTTTDPDYGKLSHYNMEELEAGIRIDVSEEKRHPFDFAVWKAKKEPDEISWTSPWGEGRPGWHIECSAMSHRYLGNDFDIHCGGKDLVFPHHENEIAQSECATGECFARFWLHNGFINVDNHKMSKSAGACFWVRDAAEKYGYQTVRYFLISSHYRTPINFSDEILQQSKTALERLQTCAENTAFMKTKASAGAMTEAEKESLTQISGKEKQFFEALDDDFNTADAIGFLFEITREINSHNAEDGVTRAYLDAASEIYDRLCTLLGLEKQLETHGDEAEIEELIAQRTAAKKAKNFAEADNIRDRLKAMGIVVEDTPQGAKWRRN